MATVDTSNHNLRYGEISGQFIALVPDTPHPELDEYPDGWGLNGTIEFEPTIPYFSFNGKSYHPQKITAVVDGQGVMRYDNNEKFYLVATDIPGAQPYGWTYKVTPKLKLGIKPINLKPYHIHVGAGQSINLATVAPVDASTGESITRGVGVSNVRVDEETKSLIFTLEDGQELPPVHIGALAEVNIDLDTLQQYVMRAESAASVASAAKTQITPMYDELKIIDGEFKQAKIEVDGSITTINGKIDAIDEAILGIDDKVTNVDENAAKAEAAADRAEAAATSADVSKSAASSFANEAMGYRDATATHMASVSATKSSIDATALAVGNDAADVTVKHGEVMTWHGEVSADADQVASDKTSVGETKTAIDAQVTTATTAASTAESAASSASSSASAAHQSSISAASSASSASSSSTIASDAADRAEAAADAVEGAAEGAYVKPISGIPKTDLSSSIQASLDKADNSAPASHTHSMADISGLNSALTSKYSKPGAGIPKTDLSTSVQSSLDKADSASQAGHTHTVTDLSDWTEQSALFYKIPDTGIPTSDLAQAVQDAVAAATSASQPGHKHGVADITGLQSSLDAKYSKPSTGIPATDLASGVRTSLGKADTASQPGHIHHSDEITYRDNALGTVTVTESSDAPGLGVHDLLSPKGAEIGDYYALGSVGLSHLRSFTKPAVGAVGGGTYSAPAQTFDNKYIQRDGTAATSVTDNSLMYVTAKVARSLKPQEFLDALPAVKDLDTIYFIYE